METDEQIAGRIGNVIRVCENARPANVRIGRPARTPDIANHFWVISKLRRNGTIDCHVVGNPMLQRLKVRSWLKVAESIESPGITPA